jgi:UDP-N-acetylglucosamine diphosphorylase/glucosamine-1-phosphate N-acetyltransferase
MKFSIIILAAGLGKRMQNPDIPKVLTAINNKPIIYYVLKTAISLNPEKICIVVGHKKELLINYIQDIFSSEFKNFRFENICFTVQEKQLGTGHATQCAANFFTNYNGNILILSGDTPAIQTKTLSDFMQYHNLQHSDISVLSSMADNPYGYGRIVRGMNNEFIEIIEEKDASEKIKTITEINSGIYFLKSNLLFSLLKQVNNNNNQNEYYLTDIIKIGKKQNEKIIAKDFGSFKEIQGINTSEQLVEVEKYMNNLI